MFAARNQKTTAVRSQPRKGRVAFGVATIESWLDDSRCGVGPDDKRYAMEQRRLRRERRGNRQPQRSAADKLAGTPFGFLDRHRGLVGVLQRHLKYNGRAEQSRGNFRQRILGFVERV